MIITSLLDLDLYKLTVGQLIFSQFRHVTAKYRMTVRNGGEIKYWTYVRAYEYDMEVESLKDLSLTEDEAAYLRTLDLFTEDYITFLSNKPMQGVRVTTHYQTHKLGSDSVPEVSGEWCRTMLYEIFCLSIANELYSKRYNHFNQIEDAAVWNTADVRLDRKISKLIAAKKPLNLIEFGTRRRMSKKWQEHMLTRLFDNHVAFGTSNVLFGMKYKVPVKGTFGHEFPMGLQGLFPVHQSQKKAFEIWAEYWKGKLAIALDDTLGEQKFFKDFTPDLMEKYDGLRHDSGCPYQWSKQRIYMYERAGFDTQSVTLFYSDGLTIENAIALDEKYGQTVKTGFGIGTHLSNDSFTPVPQVVMKIIECNGQPVAKISNNPEKASCTDPKYLEYLKHAVETY